MPRDANVPRLETPESDGTIRVLMTSLKFTPRPVGVALGHCGRSTFEHVAIDRQHRRQGWRRSCVAGQRIVADGTTYLVLSPLELMQRQAALFPSRCQPRRAGSEVVSVKLCKLMVTT